MLFTLALVVVLQIPFSGVQATFSFTVSPASRNVSAGAMVEFTCTMISKNGWIFWSFHSTLISHDTYTLCKSVVPKSGGIQETATLSFFALAEHNASTFKCSALNVYSHQSEYSSAALLMIQGTLSAVGNLTSTELGRDDCMLSIRLTWTAPYTLQGVPINYYTINITRHSDEAVLRSDTTNTTEYYYNASIMGDTLVVEVAAVNDVGIGNLANITVQPSSDNNSSQFDMIVERQERLDKNWTYYFLISEKEKICNNFRTVSVNVFKDSIMVDSTNGTTIVDGKRIVAHFMNLSEDEHFLATASVHYSQQVTQHSNHVAISTYDIWRVNYTVSSGAINFTIDYVNGSKYPHQFYIELQCASKTLTRLLNGSFGVISSVPQNEMCTLRVTDGDAAESIRTKAAFIIKKITVPGSTVYNNSTVTSTTQLTTIAQLPSTGVPVATFDPLELSPPIAAFTMTIIVILVVAVIVLTGIVIAIFFILHRKGLLCHRDAENNTGVTVSNTTDNINPLVESIEKGDPDYENISAFEMKECAAYNKPMDFNKSDPDYENMPKLKMDINGDPDYENMPKFKMSKCSAYGVSTKL